MSVPRFAAWEAAGSKCSGHAQPGAQALMAALLASFPAVKNWGIYNCRNTALGNPSAHGEGRALDLGCTIPAGNKVVSALLRLDPIKLGISVIIHNRRIYSAKTPNGRPYSGVPHLDHVHVELTRNAAAVLNLATARRVLSVKGTVIKAPKPVKVPAEPAAKATVHAPGSRTLHDGSTGPDVALVQRFLGVKDDGVFGTDTATAVKRYQRTRGLPQSGSVAPATWAPILRDLGLTFP